jgi:uncharacterized protein (DUF952 family)
VLYVLQSYYTDSLYEEIAVISAQKVKAPAKVGWEVTIEGMDSFPHVTGGPLSTQAVTNVLKFKQDAAPWTEKYVCSMIDCED